jgi:phosphocarrier protein
MCTKQPVPRMPKVPDALHQEVAIINKLGLHARPAAQIAAIARNTRHRVWLSTHEDEVDAKSTMDILMLNRPQGSKLMIRIEDDADHHILSAIARLIRNGFGELNQNDQQ